MTRKRIRNLLATTVLAVMSCGAVACAASFTFTIVAQQSQFSGTVTKSGNATSAYVASQTVSPYYGIVSYQVVNPEGYARTNEVDIEGVGHAYLPYIVTVNSGDVLRLKGTNYVSNNGGVSIYVSGEWTP